MVFLFPKTTMGLSYTGVHINIRYLKCRELTSLISLNKIYFFTLVNMVMPSHSTVVILLLIIFNNNNKSATFKADILKSEQTHFFIKPFLSKYHEHGQYSCFHNKLSLKQTISFNNLLKTTLGLEDEEYFPKYIRTWSF